MSKIFISLSSNRNQKEILSYLSLKYKLLATAYIQAGITGNPANIKEKDEQASFSVYETPKICHEM